MGAVLTGRSRLFEGIKYGGQENFSVTIGRRQHTAGLTIWTVLKKKKRSDGIAEMEKHVSLIPAKN